MDSKIDNKDCSCNQQFRSKPQSHDAIALYTEGDTLFDDMLLAINNAQSEIQMETYIFADDEVGRLFSQALSARAKSGVKVRLMVDAVGSMFQLKHMGAEMKKAGVVVRHFHRWHWRHPLRYNRRDHRKLLVVDAKTAFLGGFNIHRQSSLLYYGETRWRDTHTRFCSELARQAGELFDAFWRGEKRFLPASGRRDNSVLVPNQSRICRQRLACIYDAALNNAQTQICLTTPYFVPDHRTQKALLSAAKRGVKVHLLVPRNSDVRLARWAANAVYAHLLDGGVQIFEYIPRMLHAKVVIVDGEWATVGTANLDYRSLFQNYELNLVSNDADLCVSLQTQFETDLLESSQVCSARWQQRPWIPRLAELLGWSVRRWL